MSQDARRTWPQSALATASRDPPQVEEVLLISRLSMSLDTHIFVLPAWETLATVALQNAPGAAYKEDHRMMRA